MTPVERDAALLWDMLHAAKQATALYDGFDLNGRALCFPGWVETKPLEQAKAQAAWLQNELTKAMGAPVAVRPVVALPGWYVKTTAPGGVWVMNPKKHEFMAKAYGQQEPLSVERIKSIAYQVARLCETPDSGS